jgi:cell division protein FtsB
MYCFPHVAKDESKPSPKRRTPKPKRPARSNRAVYVLLLFVACLLVVEGLVGDRGLLAMLRARQEYDQLAATIARQRSDNARLREEARRLREDPSAIEEIARRELGLIKPGERVFIVKDIPPAKP